MELLRQLIRARIGYRSPIYRFAARLLTASMTITREGLSTYRQVAALNGMDMQNPEPVPVTFRSLAHPIYMRPGTSDVTAVLNNIVRREYGQHTPTVEPMVLVDAGAYIGDTSVYFLNRFPGIRVYALEPNPESRDIAMKNLRPYGARAELIAAALSTQVGTVRFGGEQLGARVDEGGGLEVATTTLPELIKQIPEGHIDILKMDIEGAEMDIFASDVSEWLTHVSLLIVETHGPEVTAKLGEIMASHGWTAEQFRNLYYCQSPATAS